MTKQIDETKDKLLSEIFTSVKDVTTESSVWGGKFLERVESELFEAVPNSELEKINMQMKIASAELVRRIKDGELGRDGKVNGRAYSLRDANIFDYII